MRMILPLLISTMLLFSGVAADRAQVKNWQVYFSPHGGCTEAVVAALGSAKSTVLVQAYSFTSAPIAKALVEAHRRGVKAEVVLHIQLYPEHIPPHYKRTAYVLSIVEDLHPQFAVGFQNPKFKPRGFCRSISIDWPTEAEHTSVARTISFHETEAFTLGGPTSVQPSVLKKHIQFALIDCSAD